MANQTEEQGPDIAVMAQNMAELYDTSQKIWQTYIETHPPEDPGKTTNDPLNVMPAMSQFAGTLAMNPGQLMDHTLELWSGQLSIWQAATAKMMGQDAEEIDLPEDGRRFKHPQWSENALFEYVKRSYYLTANWAQNVVNDVDGSLPDADAKKVQFVTRNVVEAMNPANFFSLNPEVLETTVTENGANLVRGAQMFLEDMTRGKGELLIRQTDMDAFEVGRDMAVTSGKVVWQNNILQLIQYAPRTKTVNKTPLLIIPPWINKYYVLDLNDKKSLIKWLVEAGHTVFVVSWVNPDESHGEETWDSYMFDGALGAIDKVLEETGAASTHVASYCIGGTLTGTLMAYLAQDDDARVASTTFFTAQLDFADAGELQVFVDQETLKQVDQEMEKGYLPAQSMAKAFNMLRSNDLIWSYVVANYMLGKSPFPFDLLYWNSDSTAMPARVHHAYLENFYLNNAFASGDMTVRDRVLNIGDIKGPVYHIATVEDHIAPATSVYQGARKMTKADVTFVLSGSGHIAGVVNPPASKKYQFWTGPALEGDTLDDWRSAAEMTDGSWWPHWDAWLRDLDNTQVAARQPGKVLGVVEDAPGAYVCKRFDQ